MVAKPGSLAPPSLIKWTWSGVKLFGGLLDFPGRPGVSYFLAWLGMKIFIFNTKDALKIFFTQCYLAAILRSASLPLKHSIIQLVYWAEIVHFLPSSTRMVASFEISLFIFSAHSALEHPGWSKSVSWFVRGVDQKLSARGNHPGTWLFVHILMLVCFLLKGLGGGWEWGGVLGWYGFD